MLLRPSVRWSLLGSTPFHRSSLLPWLVSFILMLLAAAGGSASAQTVVVADRVTCPQCRIELEHLATIGSVEERGYLADHPIPLVRDRGGRYFVSTISSAHEIGVYSSSGRFLGTLGRRGEGPGEFQWVQNLLIVPGDTLYVFDGGNARISVFSPDLALARDVRFPFLLHFMPLALTSTGNVVGSGDIKTVERIGYPLHLLDREGTLLRSFGAEEPVYRRDAPFFNFRAIAASRGGGVWAGHFTQYVIELWSGDGALRHRLIRGPSWFEPYVRGVIYPSSEEPPNRQFYGLKEDAAGRLWTLVHVPDPRYTEALGTPEPGEGGRRYAPILDYQRLRDTVIEVLDPEQASVIARARIDQYAINWIDDDELATYRETNGVPYVDIWRVRLVNPTEGGRR